MSSRLATEQGLPDGQALLAPWLRRLDTGDRLVFEYADELVTIGGRPARAVLDEVLPLLDGTRTDDEVAAAVTAPARLVHGLLAELRRQRLVVAGPDAGETAGLVAALAGGSPPAEAAARLGEARVAIVGDSDCAEELERLLWPELGDVRRQGWTDTLAADLAAAAPCPVELPLLERWNARTLESGTPWLQLLPFNGRFAAVGPLFVPRQTCCAACYSIRRAAALGEPLLHGELARTPAPYPQWRGLSAALAALGATLALRWLAMADPAVPGILFALELADGLRLDAHRVLRVPRCPACSPAAGVADPLPWAA